ncbi:hypothetical protein [Rhodococcus sp. NPDC058514]|uniref:hypothetical protein n=1 Tax=unclassified Rhodococcus (in: high G+C Gram-positive bacteria) TaxID=192944 RepID=UPI003648E716
MYDIFTLARAADAVADLFDDPAFLADMARRASTAEATAFSALLEAAGRDDIRTSFLATITAP